MTKDTKDYIKKTIIFFTILGILLSMVCLGAWTTSRDMRKEKAFIEQVKKETKCNSISSRLKLF